MNIFANKRLLIVDDDKIYTRIIKRHLLARNYEVVGEAEDGEQAMKLFKSEKPDLTLIDFEMLSSSGSEILQEIITQNPDAMVIMLTRRGDIATIQLCFDKGAYHYLRKDYPLETIVSVIEDSLKKFADVES